MIAQKILHSDHKRSSLLLLYKHSWWWLKKQSADKFTAWRRRICFWPSSKQPNVRFVPLPPAKQPTGNPTNHSCRPSTADASFQPITAALSLSTAFHRVNSRKSQTSPFKSYFRKSSGVLTTPLCKYHKMMMQQLATLAANQQHLFLHHQVADTCRPAPASPKSKHLHHQAADIYITLVHERHLCSD